MKYLLSFIPVVFYLSSISGQSLSQQSAVAGFNISASVGISGWNSDDLSGELLSGISINISPSYGFTDYLEGFFAFEYAPSVSSGNDFVDSYPSSQLEGGVRMNFGSTLSKFRPFLQVSASQHGISFIDFDGFSNDLSGYFIGFGGGVKYFLQPNLAIKAKAHADFGTYDNVKYGGVSVTDVEFDVNTVRINLGVTYVFE